MELYSSSRTLTRTFISPLNTAGNVKNGELNVAYRVDPAY